MSIRKNIYNDGELTEEELLIVEQRRIDIRQDNQKRMAWVAIVSMIVYTVVMFLPIVSDARAQLLVDMASLFYIAQAGIVGAFMGSEALVNKSRSENNLNRQQRRMQ